VQLDGGPPFIITIQALSLFDVGFSTHPLTVKARHRERDLSGLITGDPTNLGHALMLS